jgi:hypothetical protein
MTATHPQFLLYAGDTWEFDAALHDAGGVALNLANADEIEWNLRSAGRVVVAALRLSAGVEITNDVGGLCRITLLPAATVLLREGTYTDEIRVTMSDGTISTQAVGQIVAKRAGSAVAATVDENPCDVLASLRAARLDLLTGRRQVSVRMEGFEVSYSDKSDMPSLDAAIQSYEGLCAKAQGKRPRRFAMRAGMGLHRGCR